MKIVLYTSTNANIIDQYNIFRLINERPQHTYYILSVTHQENKKNPIRTFLSELKHGKNEWARDSNKVLQNIGKKIKKEVQNKVPIQYVSEVNGSESETIIKEYRPDILLQCGAGIIRENIFSIPKIGTINVHHGYAPEIRGCNSLVWALYFGLTDLLGVTVHFIDKDLDTGPVIIQKKQEYNHADSYPTLYKNIIETGSNILLEAIDKLKKYENKNQLLFEETSVKSYYFSWANYILHYNPLKKNNYLPLKNASNLKFKIKLKKVLA